jgi:hypothetical protein
MSEFELEKKMDELLDESLQTTQEMKKLALREKIKQIYEELNRDDRPLKRSIDPYWLTDNCDTISCIELTMQHDKRRYVIGWMEGEPRSDNWDGLTDNQLLILEDKEPERRAKSLLDCKSRSVW